MIEPLDSLAFAMSANKGVYALLLGSGVSRGAQIPTGWEIVLDLVRKAANLQGEDSGADPAKWYRVKFGEEPDYSKLLNTVAKSPQERSQLLRGYFEPDEEEREQGIKSPASAHRAIARLVASGQVRVIVTTNFDRLTERAIEDAGIVPTVISTPDGIQGALPLVHQRCCVLKVHGDYLDTRIKNTPDELAAYEEPIDRLLNQILDEFGMVVCGWSAQWDPALRAAFERCPSRRFTTYWAARSTLDDSAERLVKARSAVVIEIKDADTFFSALSDKVTALDEMNRPHPLSVAAMVATVKRLLSEDRHRIRLQDLVHTECDRAFNEVCKLNNGLLEARQTDETLQRAFDSFHMATQLLQELMIHGCYWARGQQQSAFAMCVQNIARHPKRAQGGPVPDLALRAYPAVILHYAGAIAALASANYSMFAAILTQPKAYEHDKSGPFLVIYPWDRLYVLVKSVAGYKDKYTPYSELLFEKLREPMRAILPDDAEYDEMFDRFEYLHALVCMDVGNRATASEYEYWWGPVGRFAWKGRYRSSGRTSVMQKIDEELASAGDHWEPLSAGLFTGSRERFRLVKEKYVEFLPTVAGSWL